jgi:hypothetical protein
MDRADQKGRVSQRVNAVLLNTLIEKILIHEAAKDEFGTRNQDIDTNT